MGVFAWFRRGSKAPEEGVPTTSPGDPDPTGASSAVSVPSSEGEGARQEETDGTGRTGEEVTATADGSAAEGAGEDGAEETDAVTGAGKGDTDGDRDPHGAADDRTGSAEIPEQRSTARTADDAAGAGTAD